MLICKVIKPSNLVRWFTCLGFAHLLKNCSGARTSWCGSLNCGETSLRVPHKRSHLPVSFTQYLLGHDAISNVLLIIFVTDRYPCVLITSG